MGGSTDVRDSVVKTGTGISPVERLHALIAADMAAIAGHGYQGIALSFVNYTQELPYFCDHVLPIFRQAGLRE